MNLKMSEIRIDKNFAGRLLEPSEGEFAALVESISINGIIVPLVVTGDHLLLDGHRRLAAAKSCDPPLATVPVRVLKTRDQGGWEKTVVILTNLQRRHLNEAQRADLGSSLLRVERIEAAVRQKRKPGVCVEHGAPDKTPDRATSRVAAFVGVSRTTIERVEKVKRADPLLAKKMLAGEVSIAGAAKKVAVEELKKKAKAEERVSSPGLVPDLAAVAGRYRCISADPPWDYNNSGTRGAAAQEYPTMTIEELAELPVGALGHTDGAMLWLWTTWPQIRDGAPHRLLAAWGFRWASELVWDKQAFGLGNWLRVQTEVLILAVKGKPQILRNDVTGFLAARSGKHSRKPAEARVLIESLCVGPRIELFARQAQEGWDRWGYEA